MSNITFSSAAIMMAVMALTTYAIRAIPLVFFNKRLEQKWIKSFLFYIPFCVLSAMTFPDVIYSTKSITSAAVALSAALILSWQERDLVVVAIAAVIVATLVEYLMLILV